MRRARTQIGFSVLLLAGGAFVGSSCAEPARPLPGQQDTVLDTDVAPDTQPADTAATDTTTTTSPDTTTTADTTTTDTSSTDVVDGPCGTVPCPSGFTCCAGECVNTQTDDRHCGMCLQGCNLPHTTTDVCQSGACVAVACESGFGDCDGDPANGCETDLAFDRAHCSACNNSCGSGRCQDGSCINDGCNMGLAECDGNTGNGCETDLLNDPAHCGGCNRPCGGAQTAGVACLNGTCLVTSCQAGFGNCDTLADTGCETPTSDDVANCGGCDVVCRPGEDCQNGACRCGTGAGCAAGEYCHEGGCAPLPTFAQDPACADLGVPHLAPDFTVRYVVTGRPGATVHKYNQHLGCGTPAGIAFESMDGTQVLDASGQLEVVIEDAMGAPCTNTAIIGEYESWAVVDGFETNHVRTTLLNSTCPDFDTCPEAAAWCGQ